MARKGENIYKRKDGRWEGRYIHHYDKNGKAHYQSVYAASYSEAKAKLLQKKQQTLTPLQSMSYKTLQCYCDEWLISVKLKSKESTYCKYRSICEKHIIPLLGKYPVDKISTALAEQFICSKLESFSLRTVGGILCVLKMVIAYAEQENCHTICNFSSLTVKQEQEPIQILTLEEQRQFSMFLRKNMDCCKLGVYLSLYSGIRIGELCALQWKNILLEERILKITATLQRIQSENIEGAKTKIVITSPKSKYSIREIPLTDSLIELLTQYRSNDENYLLTGKENYMEPRTLQYRFKNFLEECELKDINFHALRHTFATRCVEAGFEIKTLSEILGHSSVNITLSRYV
ncbi:MAG: tyrosine-type recombinase/integrase, partial [Porcipelethomonas sp.]